MQPSRQARTQTERLSVRKVTSCQKGYIMNYTKPPQTSQTKNHPTSKVSLRSQFHRFSLACGTTIALDAVEAAGLSYIPCTHEQPLFKYAHLWDSPTQINLDTFPDAHGWGMERFQGVQIFTGKPTKRYRDERVEYLVVLDFETRFIEKYPDLYQQIERIIYRDSDRTPFLIETKSGGRHIYGYSDYLDAKYEFRERRTEDHDDDRTNPMLAEFHSEKGLARLDDRYKQLSGSLFDLPSLPKTALQEIYRILCQVADERQHNISEPQIVVEKSKLDDSDYNWDKGKSRYFPTSFCQVTDHNDQSRKTVQFRKWDGGIKGVCYNCGESWWEVEPAHSYTDPPPQPLFNHIPELRTVSTHSFGIPSDNGWQTGLTHRRLSAPDDLKPCSQCENLARPEIDFGRLVGSYRCEHCETDTPAGSYLLHVLNRTADNAIISDFPDYISDDPLLESEPIWTPLGVFYIDAAMNTGKTTLVQKRAWEASRHEDIKTIIVVPRASLAKGLYQSFRRDDTHFAYSLHYDKHERNKLKSERWKIGEIGAICTLGVLPYFVEKLKERGIRYRLFFDEFDEVGRLHLSKIFKDHESEVRKVILESIEEEGIAIAGATIFASELEYMLRDLSPNVKLRAYHKKAPPATRTATLRLLSTETEQGITIGPKNALLQEVVEKIQSMIDTGKNAYVFGDECSAVEVLASFFPEEVTLIYDKYHKDSPENEELLYQKRLSEGKRIFISSNAVDVGLSIIDENAEAIVFSIMNPKSHNGMATVVQKCLRVRNDVPLTIFFFQYRNALPLNPTQAIRFEDNATRQVLSTDEPIPETLVQRIGITNALKQLAIDQPVDYLRHHLRRAGYDLSVSTDPSEVDPQSIKVRKKEIADRNRQIVNARAVDLLCPEHLKTEDEIRDMDWSSLQPAPWEQRAREHANAVMRFCGWDGTAERFVDEDNLVKSDDPFPMITDEMWQMAKRIVGVDTNKFERWLSGVLPIHYFQAAIAEFDASTQYAPHHRPRSLFRGELLKALLKKLRKHASKPVGKEVISRCLIQACQTRVLNRQTNRFELLSTLVKDGSVSSSISEKVRHLDLGPDATPTDAHLKFVQWLVSEYYPARIAKDGELYQLAAPTDTDEVELFYQAVRCHIKHRYPELDPDDFDDPDDSDLTPPPATDPLESKKQEAREMKAQGKNRKVIAAVTGMSLSWVSKHTADVEKLDPKAELKAKIIQLKAEGKTFKECSEILNIPTSTLSRWWNERSHFGHANSNINTSLEISVPKMGSGKPANQETPNRLAQTDLLPALTHATAPEDTPISDIIELDTLDVGHERGYQGNVALLNPADVPRLMRDNVEELGVAPFVPTAEALDTILEYRWTRLQKLTSKILLDPEKYEELVEPFMDYLMANKGRDDPHASEIVSFLVLRTWEGESWWRSIPPTVNLRSAVESLFRRVGSAADNLADIHDNSWVFACRNEALVKYPITDFVQYFERRGIF